MRLLQSLEFSYKLIIFVVCYLGLGVYVVSAVVMTYLAAELFYSFLDVSFLGHNAKKREGVFRRALKIPRSISFFVPLSIKA